MTTSECPCGRARAGCEYHDPTLQPAPEYLDLSNKHAATLSLGGGWHMFHKVGDRVMCKCADGRMRSGTVDSVSPQHCEITLDPTWEDLEIKVNTTVRF